VDNDYLVGDAAIDAIGWAEDRREELVLKKEEQRRTQDHGQEHQLIRMLDAFGEIVLLLKMVVVLMGVMCGMIALVLVSVMKK
jgi:hypothetical protein